MMLSVLSAAVLGSVFPAEPPVGEAGLRLADLETALTVTGWDIVHMSETRDGGIVIGARARDGWPVIHTLSSCKAGVCQAWTQSVPLEQGLLERSVSMDSYIEFAGNRLGSSLIGEETASGEVALKGAMLGRPCDADCQMQAIESFASATRVSYRALSGQHSAATAHTGFDGFASGTTATPLEAAPMDHRQIAAIVSATEDEADRQNARFVEPVAERTWELPETTGTGTISFPPLLPE